MIQKKTRKNRFQKSLLGTFRNQKNTKNRINKLAKLRRCASHGKHQLERVWARKSFGLTKLGDGGDFLVDGGKLIGDCDNLLGGGGDLLGDGGNLLSDGGNIGEKISEKLLGEKSVTNLPQSTFI